MEHNENFPPEAATNEPASFANTKQTLPAVRVSGQLTESLIDDALGASRDSRPGWTQRSDGWTPERIRTFIEVLSQCGVVSDAARAAGMNPRSAYALRNSAKGRAFDIAWRAAQLLARRRLADELMSRAVNGCVEVIMRDGQVWGERHRYDNRLSMAVLTRLDALAVASDEGVVRAAADEVDQFLDLACTGSGEVIDFIRSRCPRGEHYSMDRESEVLERTENYLRLVTNQDRHENGDGS